MFSDCYLMGSGKYFRTMYILSDIWKDSGWNAIIVVSAVPLLVIYPMVQKFFERGIMMGSLKG